MKNKMVIFVVTLGVLDPDSAQDPSEVVPTVEVFTTRKAAVEFITEEINDEDIEFTEERNRFFPTNGDEQTFCYTIWKKTIEVKS